MSTKEYIGKESFIAGWNADLVNHSIIFAIPWFAYISHDLCSFTQRIDVNGEVITLPHSVNVYAPQQGFIVSQYVKVGDLVKKDNLSMK